MTVIREQQRIYTVSLEGATASVESILGDRSHYKDTNRNQYGEFDTDVKGPFFLCSDTRMTVRIFAFGEGVVVTARTESGSLIAGDIFDFYNGYLRRFFDSLRASFDPA